GNVPKMRNKRMNSDPQAMEEIERKACGAGSTRRGVSAEYPAIAPKIVPAATPNANPQATRQSVVKACCASSPLAARSVNVFQITDGGGTRRPLDKPMRTAISQNTASATGSNKPSAGRRTRADPAFGAACDSSACSTPAVMETRDTARPSNAISRNYLNCRADTLVVFPLATHRGSNFEGRSHIVPPPAGGGGTGRGRAI